MPLIDMPLEQLRTYTGRNPRPDDFDAFWDEALAELDAVDPQIELRPADFQTAPAECFHLFFTGVGGARIHAKLVKPKHIDGQVPGIVEFHGYSGRSADWSGLLNQTARGYVIAAMDCRGQGGMSEDVGGVRGNTLHGHIIRGLHDKPQRLLFRSIFLDTARLARIVMDLPYVDADRVGAQGGSQGGGLTLACASLEPRIARAAATFPFLCDYLRVWEMDLGKNAYAELTDYFRRYDPLHESREQAFTRLGYIDVQHLAPRIGGKVLMGVGLMDNVCPPSTQFAAFNKITADKELAIYPDYGHEGLPGFSDRVYQFMEGL